jgi:hypothetical protein
MGEISAASEEQSSGIDQVNRAVSQMDEVTQQNAALVEEAAAVLCLFGPWKCANHAHVKFSGLLPLRVITPEQGNEQCLTAIAPADAGPDKPGGEV